MIEAKLRNNELFLKMSKVTDMRFEVIDCIASDGQPIEREVTCEVADDGMSWKLTFKAGRHGSDKVAKEYVKYLTDDKGTTGASIGCTTLEESPDKLNFAFLGNLYIQDHDDKNSGNSGPYCIAEILLLLRGILPEAIITGGSAEEIWKMSMMSRFSRAFASGLMPRVRVQAHY